MKKIHFNPWIRIGSVALFALLLAHPANAVNWTGNAGDGLFLTDGNWDTESKPGASDIARFGPAAGGDYTVTLGADHSIGRLYLAAGGLSDVTLDLGGNTLTTTNTGNVVGIYVNANDSEDRTLRVTNGTADLAGSFILGSISDDDKSFTGTGRLIVENGGTMSVQFGGSAEWLFLGTRNNGELQINSGGNVIMDTEDDRQLYLGYREGTGRVIVRGTGEWDLGGSTLLRLAGEDGSKGYLEIRDGGTVKNGGVIVVGYATDTDVEASILVDGKDSTLTADALRISRRSSTGTTLRTPGTVTVSNEGHITLTSSSAGDELVVGDGGTLAIDGGTVTVQNKGTIWHAGSTYELTLHDKTATPLTATSEGTTLADTGDGVTFSLGNMAYGSYWSTFQVGDHFDVLLYGDKNNLTGIFAGIGEGDAIETPDGEWEFLMRYAFNPTGTFGEAGYDENEYRIALELNVIPEPHSLGLILLGLGAMAARRLRRAAV